MSFFRKKQEIDADRPNVAHPVPYSGNCREKWQRDAALVADLNARNSDQVKLDIGGTQLATTTRETLVQGDTMLTAMFSGRHKLKIDEEVGRSAERESPCLCVYLIA